MDRDDPARRREASHEGDALGDLAPGRADRHAQQVHLTRLSVQGVARVEEHRLALGADDDAGVADARHVGVVVGVPLAHAGEHHPGPAELDRPARAEDLDPVGIPRLDDLPSGLGLHEHPGAGVGAEQVVSPLGVEVVGVLVRDDHRGEVAQPVEVGEGARVHEDALPGDLDEQAGMSEVRDLHTSL